MTQDQIAKFGIIFILTLIAGLVASSYLPSQQRPKIEIVKTKVHDVARLRYGGDKP